MKRTNAALAGLGLVVAGALYFLYTRPRHLRWGATDDEVNNFYPGDGLIKMASAVTHAITIHATCAEVWPWLAQVGQGRAGFYSYSLLENLVGCEMVNRDQIVPELQHPEQGDPIHLHPKAPPMTLAVVNPPYDFVLLSAEGEPNSLFSRGTWAMYLRPTEDGRCRLICRVAAERSRGVWAKLFDLAFMEPAHFVMERKMMLTIRRLAEETNLDSGLAAIGS